MHDSRRPEGGGAVSDIRHYLSAVHIALDLPRPRGARDQLPYLSLLEQRSRVALDSIGRLIALHRIDELDYASEGDHILHQIAGLAPDTYLHDDGGLS
jgi:hypothetical protein